MSIDLHSYGYSRRRLLTQVGLAGVFGRSNMGTTQTNTQIETIALGGGIEIRDYRLMPSRDAARIIVEVHNTTDDFLDTPLVGVIIPALTNNEDFVVAVAVTPVIYPHSSVAMFGILPRGVTDITGIEHGKWVLCNPLHTELATKLRELDVKMSYLVTAVPNGIRMDVALANLDSAQTAIADICGEVYDPDGRICGAIPPRFIRLQPEEEQNLEVYALDFWEYISSPFLLADSEDPLTVELTVQPRAPYQPLICPTVMPWNR